MNPAETKYLHPHIDTRQFDRLRDRDPLRQKQEGCQNNGNDYRPSAVENSLDQAPHDGVTALSKLKAKGGALPSHPV